MKSSNISSIIPRSLLKLYLTEQHFKDRFQLINVIEDPYVRVYEISRDCESGKRVAVRSYVAVEGEQQHDVIENMQSFRKLGDVSGMCKLIAFAKKEAGGIISAAFQYNDLSIEELLQTQQYDNVRYQLYLLILREMVTVIDNARTTGIIIEEIIPACVLLETAQEEFHLKILYDEREKKYDKIQEGIKVLASPEKIETVLKEQRDYESVNCEQAIFELGLLLLDLIFEFEMRSYKSQQMSIFAKDIPLQRTNLSHKSYLLFHDSTVVKLNHSLITQKMQFLLDLNNPFITQLLALIEKMIATIDQRQTLQQISEDINMLETVVVQLTKVERKEHEYLEFITPAKESIQLESEKVIPKKEETNANGLTNFIKNITSQTTAASPHVTSTSDNVPKYSQQISDPKIAEIFIPRDKLLNQVRNNTSLLPKFEKFISKLERQGGIIKKEYFDGSSYYGELNANNKRDGSGIYVYNNGDIYFGSWKDNVLVDGNYLFRNGESFEGVVKGGKQGYGRYCYSNGNIYQGEWRDDVKNGSGKMKYPNGDIYEGMWNKGKKNGQGKYFYSNGTLYVGNFVDGKKNGFGVITFPNNTKIEAYWNQAHIEGPGKVFYTNGNYFEGNYHYSEKQGKGYYKWEDAQYEGEFQKDLMQGHACIRFSDKEYYNGRIKNGKRDGKGHYQYSNGDEFTGDWRNDEKVLGHYKFHEGGSFEGRFKQNQLSYGVMIYENGQSYQGEFLKGSRHGLGVYRGSKSEILYQGKWQHDQYISSL